MSNASQFFSSGGGVKSFQTGFISTTTIANGSGEDVSYVDVTLSSVDTSKCLVFFDGAFSDSVNNATFINVDGVGVHRAIPRLTSSTNLRISSSFTALRGALAGRWYVMEFK